VYCGDHALCKHFHKPGDEKRMVVILREDQYDEWLDAPASRSMDFMWQFPAELLMATAEPDRGEEDPLTPSCRLVSR
jgi:putative SOS response-associated peptidase YedK